MFTSTIAVISYTVGVLVALIHGIMWILRREFVTRDDIKVLESKQESVRFTLVHLDATLKNLDKSVQENTVATKEVVSLVGSHSSRLAILEEKVK